MKRFLGISTPSTSKTASRGVLLFGVSNSFPFHVFYGVFRVKA
jgi:hypothetical protein